MTVTGFISCSLERIFGHIGVRSNNTATITMLKICLNLIQDSDFNVRELFRWVLNQWPTSMWIVQVSLQSVINIIANSSVWILFYWSMNSCKTLTALHFNRVLNVFQTTVYLLGFFSRVWFYSRVIGSMVGEGSSDSNQLIVRTLKETLESARLQGNVRLQQTVILTIAQIGRWGPNQSLGYS